MLFKICHITGQNPVLALHETESEEEGISRLQRYGEDPRIK